MQDNKLISFEEGIKVSGKKEKVFEHYAKYLTECISEIKFLDKDNLRQYLTTHLHLFYSECLDDHLLPDIERRYNYLVQENQKLMLARIEMEEQILSAKSALRERKYVDTGWLARVNYAFRIKGAQMQNNNAELKKLGDIKRAVEKKTNIEMANSRARAQYDCFKSEYKERFGKEAMIEFVKKSDERLHEKFKIPTNEQP